MANNQNDDFDNEPLGTDFDQDPDFGEFGGDEKKNSIGSVWKSSPAVKFGLVGAAILVVVAAVALFGGQKAENLGSQVRSGGQGFKETPGTGEVSPSMREAVEEKNQQNLEDALKSGSSSIPIPIEPPKALLGVPQDEAGGEDPLVRWKRLQEERVRFQREQEKYTAETQVDPNQQQRVQDMTAAMTNQFQTILEKQTIAQMQHMTVMDMEAYKQSLVQTGQQAIAAGNAALAGSVVPASATAGTAINPVTGLPLVPTKVLVPAGEIEYAQLLVEANSDIPGPVVAMVVSGPFNGSRVLGSFQKTEEYLVLKFTTLVGKDGHSIPINATAVDPDTTLTGMATDVDHRYMSRIILPAAAKFIEGLGSAIAENGSTTVTVSGDTVAQSTSDLNTKEELSKAASEASTKVGEILDEEANQTEVLVRIKAGTPFGMLFLQPVTDSDINGSKFNNNMTAAQNQQQQNNQNGMMFNGQNGGMNPMQLLQQGLNGQMMMQQQGNGMYYPANGMNTMNGMTYPATGAPGTQLNVSTTATATGTQ